MTHWCFTPDCGAPICKVTIVKTDHDGDPLEIVDKNLTEKMLLELKAKKEAIELENRAIEKEKEETAADASQANAAYESLLMAQLEQAKANQKALTKQLNTVKMDNFNLEKRVEDFKSNTKRLSEENKMLKSTQQGQMSQQESLKREVDRLNGELRRLRNKSLTVLKFFSKIIFCNILLIFRRICALSYEKKFHSLVGLSVLSTNICWWNQRNFHALLGN